MFNPIYEHPMEMFCLQHIIALLVAITVILTVFFLRKFFMNNALADRIFRYTLVVILLVFELVPLYHNKVTPLFSYNILEPYPLCTFLLWITVVALLSNSSRIMRIAYPLDILGASLSLIVVSTKSVFPHFTAFSFFFTHGTFLLGALYFVFTKKIVRYTIKDVGQSCFFLFGLASYSVIHSYTIITKDPTFVADEFFLLAPPDGLESVKEALGQVGYTIAFIAVVVSIIFAVYGLTYLCTWHRKYEDNNEPIMKQNTLLDKLSKLTIQQRWLIIALVFGLGIFNGFFRLLTNSMLFTITDIIFYVALLTLFVLNEVLFNYDKFLKLQSQETTKTEIDEKIDKNNSSNLVEDN